LTEEGEGLNNRRVGRIEIPEEITVCFGPMFSGKTEGLIDGLVRARIAGLPPLAFKPAIDNRGEGSTVIKGKAGSEFPAISIREPKEILKAVGKETRVVGIDEAQFLSPAIVEVVRQLSQTGKRVVVAGLPADFRGEPFGPMPDLMAIAHKLIQFTAVCTFRNGEDEICGSEATQTQRLIGGKPAGYDDPIVLVGGSEAYEARCRKHHFVPR